MLKNLKTVPDPAAREKILLRATQSMAYFKPAEGGRLFLELPVHAQTAAAAANIVGRMAEQDPEEALRWALNLGTEDLKNRAQAAVLDHLENTDPAAAEREIFKISDPQMRAEKVHSLAGTMADADSAKAEQWAAGLNGLDRLAALRAVTEQAANVSPERAQELYQKYVASLSAEEAEAAGFEEVALTIAYKLAEMKPERSASWALSLPEGGVRETAVSGLISVWANENALAASEWVNSLPPGGSRDSAAEGLVGAIARSDPDSAWVWATKISDTTRRLKASRQVLSGWEAVDRADLAREAVRNGNFTDEERKDLESYLK